MIGILFAICCILTLYTIYLESKIEVFKKSINKITHNSGNVSCETIPELFFSKLLDKTNSILYNKRKKGVEPK